MKPPFTRLPLGIALASAALGVALLLAAPAAALNKCTTVDGRVTYQDAPCPRGTDAVEVDAAPAYAPSPARGASGPPSASEAARLEALIAASQRARRALDLRERLLPDAERGLQEHRRACEQEQRALAAERDAFATTWVGRWQASIVASEMAAAAARCETKERELKEQLDALASECAALRCKG